MNAMAYSYSLMDKEMIRIKRWKIWKKVMGFLCILKVIPKNPIHEG